MAEYIVTVTRDANWQELHNDLTRDTTADSTVDSNIVPDRVVDVANLRQANTRSTHYDLTEDEVEKLKQDSRVLAIELKQEHTFKKSLEQEGNFNQYELNETGQHDNWGLLTHTNQNQIFGTGKSLSGNPKYNYVLDGTGVDFVVMDTGIQADHPEFNDSQGNSRVKKINWFTAAGVGGYFDVNGHYQDMDGHGTHVAGTAAGLTFGWAKNAHIYNMSVALSGSPTPPHSINLNNTYGGLSSWDLIKVWHQKKNDPSDPSYTGRPTVVNMSYGTSYSYDWQSEPNRVDGFEVTGVVFRGTTYYGTSYGTLYEYGITGYDVPYRVISLDAEIEQMIDAGIVVCIAAGNDNFKTDVFGGADFNNQVFNGQPNTTNSIFYNRGSSPALSTPDETERPGFKVGALRTTNYSSSLYQRANFSNMGPGVNIYTAGQGIISALSNSNDYSSNTPYHLNNNFKQAKFEGTSMASPQMAGLASCLLQAHLDWSPKQVRDYFISNAKDTIFYGNDSFLDAYQDQNNLMGGHRRVAYLPMNGNKPFGYSSS